MNLSEIIWGDDSAEKDPNLLQYFVTNSSLNRLQGKSKSIIVGRKGSGKSAIKTKLVEYFRTKDDVVVEINSNYKLINNRTVDQEVTGNLNSEIFFQYVWLRHMLLNALNTIGNTLQGEYAKGSFEFARSIALEQGRTNADLLESIVKILTRLKVNAGKLGDLGIDIEKVLKSASQVDSFEFHIREIANSGTKITFFIDDLDMGWDNSNISNNYLLGLLATINYLKEISLNIHVFIFLREDVYQILLNGTTHSDKYRDVESIKWNSENLISLLSERIRYNYTINGIHLENDPFYMVFPQMIGRSNTINWLVERTLGRPRELIQLARIYTENNESESPNQEKLKKVEATYSNWKLDDLCSEFMYQYPGLKDIFQLWKVKFAQIKFHLKRDEIEEILFSLLEKSECNEEWLAKIRDKVEFEELLKILYKIGLIGDYVTGGQGGSKAIYSDTPMHHPTFREVQIHPCFRKALGTVERIRSSKKSI